MQSEGGTKVDLIAGADRLLSPIDTNRELASFLSSQHHNVDDGILHSYLDSHRLSYTSARPRLALRSPFQFSPQHPPQFIRRPPRGSLITSRT